MIHLWMSINFQPPANTNKQFCNDKPFCTCLGIGLIITSYSSTGSAYLLVVAVSQALAGGTLIYVAVFEVLERERSKNITGLVQVAFVILGFCVMMLVEFFGKLFIVIIFNNIYCKMYS
jgi:hypothetical protein